MPLKKISLSTEMTLPKLVKIRIFQKRTYLTQVQELLYNIIRFCSLLRATKWLPRALQKVNLLQLLPFFYFDNKIPARLLEFKVKLYFPQLSKIIPLICSRFSSISRKQVRGIMCPVIGENLFFRIFLLWWVHLQ